MEIIYFGDHGTRAPLATSMVLWQLHSTVLVLDNDYLVFASLLSTQNCGTVEMPCNVTSLHGTTQKAQNKSFLTWLFSSIPKS